MKTIKQIAAVSFIALFLMVGNLKATETKASSHEIIETTLQLESWMTDEEIWNNDVQIAEATLTVEDWMINNEFWQ